MSTHAQPLYWQIQYLNTQVKDLQRQIDLMKKMSEVDLTSLQNDIEDIDDRLEELTFKVKCKVNLST